MRQVAVAALPCNVTLRQREYRVIGPERGQTVGHDQRGSVAHRRSEGGPDVSFAFGVEAGDGFVQYQHARLLEHHAGERDPLTLPRG